MGLAYHRPTEGWRLRGGEVALCLVPLAASRACIEELEASLSRDERARAERFRTAALRDDFVIGRGTLRALLGHCAQRAPAELAFEYGESGKPRLAGEPRLRFNLSHSGGRALYAFTLDRDVGVDLERIRALPDAEQIARQHFSAAEIRDLASLPAAEKTAAFHRCWTRKEAYIKARGEGLMLPLDAFRVAFLAGEAPRLETSLDARAWSLVDASPDEGHAAALAIEGAPPALRAWAYDDAEHAAGIGALA